MARLRSKCLLTQNDIQSGSYSDGLEALGELIHGKGADNMGATYILHGGVVHLDMSPRMAL